MKLSKFVVTIARIMSRLTSSAMSLCDSPGLSPLKNFAKNACCSGWLRYTVPIKSAYDIAAYWLDRNHSESSDADGSPTQPSAQFRSLAVSNIKSQAVGTPASFDTPAPASRMYFFSPGRALAASGIMGFMPSTPHQKPSSPSAHQSHYKTLLQRPTPQHPRAQMVERAGSQHAAQVARIRCLGLARDHFAQHGRDASELRGKRGGLPLGPALHVEPR